MSNQELRMVIKAKDEASAALRKIGSEMNGVGKHGSSLGSVLKGVGVGFAAMMAAGVAAGLAIIAVAKKCLTAWYDYMGAISKVNMLTGLTAKSSSMLVGEAKLLGVSYQSLANGVKFFAKNTDAAHAGNKTMLEMFKRLGVTLKDSAGHWLKLDTLLPRVQKAFAALPAGALRTAAAVKLFGRGGTDMMRWLTDKNLGELDRFIRANGMAFGPKAVADFAKYRQAQEKMLFAWEALKVKAGAALAPIVAHYLPLLSQWFTKHQKGIADGIAKIAQKAADLAAAIPKVGTWIMANWKAVAFAGAAAFAFLNPALTTVGLLTAGLYGAYKAGQWLREKGDQRTADIKQLQSMGSGLAVKPSSITSVAGGRSAAQAVNMAKLSVSSLANRGLLTPAEEVNAMRSLNKLSHDVQYKLFDLTLKAKAAGKQVVTNFILPLSNMRLTPFPSKFTKDEQKFINQELAKWRKLGLDMTSGLAAGIQRGTPYAVKTAIALAAGCTAQAAHQLQAKSPSQVMVRLGQGVSTGLALGIQRDGHKPVSAIGLVAASITNVVSNLANTLSAYWKRMEAQSAAAYTKINATALSGKWASGGGSSSGNSSGGSAGGLYGAALKNFIKSGSSKRGLDPRAVLAIASVEGGFSGAVGDHGTSFGPFQLHIGGALPAGKGKAWAQSGAGVNYALNKINAVAHGLKGAAAVYAISSKFERPADVAGEVARAMRYYDSGGYLPPGLSLAMNATGKPERVMSPGQEQMHGSCDTHVHVYIDGREVAYQVARRNGTQTRLAMLSRP